MKKAALKLVLMALAAWISVPVASWASEEDLQKKIDKLSKEVDELTGQVKKTEDKSLGKWLSIGGDYRYRIDSLHGRTVPYTDAIGTMGNMTNFFINGNAFGGPGVAGTFGTPTGTQFIMMSQPGKLFTQDQMGVLLNQYMPTVMGGMLLANSGGAPGPAGTFLANLAANPAGSVAGFPAFAPLTVQQRQILSALQNGLPGQPQSVINAAGAFYQAHGGDMAQFGAIMADTVKRNYLLGAMMQAFLGDPSKLPAGLPPTFASPHLLQQVPAFKPKNETEQTNMFGIDLHAKATQDVTVNARLLMYKTFGSQSDAQVTGNFFADRVGVFDGTLSHIPSSSLLNVDRAYATWSNIGDQPIWLSLGRRPSTNGAPTNLKHNNARPGNGGTPAMLIDYGFDGGTIGWAPDIEALPGAYAKFCYGRGFDSGIKTPTNSIKDTDFAGVAIIPIDTDPLRVWFQWMRAWDIFDFPVMNNTIFGNTGKSVSLGNIDWYGAGAMSTFKKVGPGDLNFFTDFAMSITHPGGNVSQNAGFQGLLTGAFFAPEAPSDKTGYSAWVGVRYDLPSKTKLGFEYNHGSKNWITFSPAADDLWTSKIGTRGNVYDGYIIQELNLKPISSYISKAFFKIGYQYYDFEYTGSNNWVGAPVKISDIKPTDLMLLAPLKEAHDIYGTFEVHF